MFNWLIKGKKHHELLAASEFNGILQTEVNRHIEPLGFKSYKIGQWIKPGPASIKYLFEIKHYKGATSVPIWGVSLDYVPHMDNSRSKICWHRTNKSALMDLFPFYSFDKSFDFSRLVTSEKHKKIAKALIPKTVASAVNFYNGINGISDLIPVFEKTQTATGTGLGYWNYVQIPLSYAFTLKVLGDYKKGRKALNEYIAQYKLNSSIAAELMNKFEQT